MASHIATIRGSARMAAQQQKITAAAAAAAETADITSQDDTDEQLSGDQGNPSFKRLEESTRNEQQSIRLSEMSINDDNSESSHDMNARKVDRRPRARTALVPMPLKALTSVADIESHLETDLHQIQTLAKLEEKWLEINKNFDDVVGYLHESSDAITKASGECIRTLHENIETTCDKVDLELKAMYHLMTKCDELTTKLSIASSFRDEIKTLRKSVESLETLWKTKPASSLDQKLVITSNASNGEASTS